MRDMIMQLIEKLYIVGLNHNQFMKRTAHDLAGHYLRKACGNPLKAANMLVKGEATKTGVSGFLSGLGGFITLPAGIGADLANSLMLNMRMCQAIAILAGCRPEDDKVKLTIILIVIGNNIKETGLNKLMTRHVGKEVLEKMVRKVLIKFVEEVSEKTVTQIAEKMIPLVGGAIGGVANYMETRAVGKVCIKVFFNKRKK